MSIKSLEKENAITRRGFLKNSALLGIGATGALGCSQMAQFRDAVFGDTEKLLAPYELAKPENIIYSVCLNCHIRCPMKTKFQDGVLVKIDGNPYAAKTFMPNLPLETKLSQAARIDGHFCPKGQAGVQTYYDPYRIRQTLKRVGPRGGNQWQTIPFEKAIDEIVEGGNLFNEGHVAGLKEIYALRDADLAQTMGQDVSKIRKGTMTVNAFQNKHNEYLNVLIDPEHPDLGPKNNQFCFMAGRIQHGRVQFAKRWTHGGLGSINWMDHTSICAQSHWIASKRFTWDPQKKVASP